MKKSLLFFFLASFILSVNAQTNTFNVASGSWNTAGNWSLAHIPTSSEDAVIPNGSTVTGMSSGTGNVCKTLTVSGVLTFSGGNPRQIIVSGNVTVNSTGVINMTGSNAYYIDFSGTSFSVASGATLTMTTTGLEGGVRCSATSGTVNITNNSASTFGSINVTGANTTQVSGTTFNMTNILVSNASGIFNVSSGQTVTTTTKASTVTSGKIVLDGTWINQSTTTMSLTGAGAVTVNSGGKYVHNTTSGIATPLGQFTLNTGSNFIYRGSSTVNAAVSIAGKTFYNLTFESSSGTWAPTLSGTTALTVNGNLSIGGTGAGTFNSGTGFSGDITVAGDVSIVSGSTMAFASNYNIGGSWTNAGTFTQASAKVVTFNGTGTQTITRSGGQTFT